MKLRARLIAPGRLRAGLEAALCLGLALAAWRGGAGARVDRTFAGPAPVEVRTGAPRPEHQAQLGPYPETAPSSAGFPREVRDHRGGAVRLARPPSRIASQALVTDHFLFALVSPSRIVAVSPVARDPRYSYVAGVVAGMDVAVADDGEALLRRRPDLLVVSQTARADLVALARAAGVPTFRLPTVFDDFSQIAGGLETVGRLTGAERAAEQAVRRFRERVAAAAARRPAASPPPRVLVYASFSGTFGAGSLFDHVLTTLGAVNVAAEQGIGPHATIGGEQIAAWNPDWIVADAPAGEEAAVRRRLLENPAVAVTTAGRTGQILVVDHRRFITMSHHAAGLTEAVAAALYPDAP